ncbi:MAG: tetratricopeptide repeat protein, partial [Thermoflexales bacterium]|nr:tetratricopeptide repeat protein [Thermoflexales bacterium]
MSNVDLDTQDISIGGDVIGRDKHVSAGGDVVGRDKISVGDISGVTGGVVVGSGQITHIHEAPAPPIPFQRPPRPQHFVDRRAELAQLVADLQPGRVVTLCGPGGIGKTALAAEVIWQMAPGDNLPDCFPHGIVFHTFYSRPEAAIALESIARAYGHDPRPDPAAAAQIALAGKRALLVLDGAEQADNLPAVLQVAGSCSVLVTSRAHRNAPEDWLDITPLPNAEAVQLIRAWGKDCAADSAAAGRICDLVGRLPLAVRLAGRYMAQRRQTAADYLAWLQDTPLAALDQGTRQRDSIPLLLERSLAQVSETARQALAVAGMLDITPFGRQVIVVGLEAEPAEAGRVMGELVDYGLLLPVGERYQVSHALVHTYAHGRLAPPPEILMRLAAHYEAFAKQQSALGLEGFARLNEERTHILAIQRACLAAGQWNTVRGLTWAIEDYLDLQGHSTERRTTLEMGLQAARASGHRQDERAFLNDLGNVYRDLGDAHRAIEFYEQSLVITREIGDRRGEGQTVNNLGNAYSNLGDARRAIEFYEQSLVITREIGDRRGE